MKQMRLLGVAPLISVLLALPSLGQSAPDAIHSGALTVATFDDGSYALRSAEIPDDVLRAQVEADTAAGTLSSSLYPRHLRSISKFSNALGSGQQLTAEPRSHSLSLDTLGVNAKDAYTATNLLRGGSVSIQNNSIALTLPPHSVRMVKLIDTSLPEPQPDLEARVPAAAQTGDLALFHSATANADTPVLNYRWEFGDGVSAEGADASHAYTLADAYTVKLTATGLNGRTTQKDFPITITGSTPTNYNPAAKQR